MSAPGSILQITFRHNIWRVWLDSKFYGDYRSRADAVESAETAQRDMARTGRRSSIVMAPGI